jgi:hypothetical protein
MGQSKPRTLPPKRVEKQTISTNQPTKQPHVCFSYFKKKLEDNGITHFKTTKFYLAGHVRANHQGQTPM